MRGKGTGGGLDGTFYKDHPRLCGEKSNRLLRRNAVQGSPPPMRGKAKDDVDPPERVRITPAYAGKSTWKCMPFATLQDHPRLCGEKYNLVPPRHSSKGSPPPMRGKEKILSFLSRSARITPAYAGKSALRSKVERNDGDHPRLCGEKSGILRANDATTGSPPPMRGKDDDLDEIDYWDGITPAYAGKSSIVSPSSAVDWDHPRLCGEKSGKNQCRWIYNRITPAYAGKRSRNANR